MTNKNAELLQRIGKNVKYHRQNAKMTQVQLALKAGLSADYIPHVEQGKNFPSLTALCKLADVLNIDPHEFLKP